MAAVPGSVQIDFPHRRAGHCGSGAPETAGVAAMKRWLAAGDG